MLFRVFSISAEKSLSWKAVGRTVVHLEETDLEVLLEVRAEVDVREQLCTMQVLFRCSFCVQVARLACVLALLLGEPWSTNERRRGSQCLQEPIRAESVT